MPRGIPPSVDDVAFVRRMIADYKLTNAASILLIPVTTLRNVCAGQLVRRGTLLELRAKRKKYEDKHGKVNVS